MVKFCSNCGNKLSEGNKYCRECGFKINIDSKLSENINPKSKVPGKGISIAGMILGIISALWCSQTLLSLNSFEYIASTINQFTSMYYVIFFAIGFTLFSLVPSIVGLLLSAVGMGKSKNGYNISGLVLNIVALLISVMEFIYILSFI